jgi:ComF family protein
MGVFTGILDLLFPQKCTFCRKLLHSGESGMCAACARDIPYTRANAKRSGDFFSVCVSPLYYEGDVREAILRFKFRNATSYAGLFGRLIADCIRENLAGEYALISWVPLSAKRLRKRGYDQSMLLAMAAALELDDVAVETLVKHTDVPAQSGMGSAEKRRASISGSYAVSDAELVAGKRILLIDDIVTTGSTLSECARTLLGAGAEKVVCATLARTENEN